MHLGLNLATFASLKNRNYRLLWFAVSISAAAEFSDLLVLGWLVLQLTGSPWQVALVSFCQMAPMLVIGLIAGAVGDRTDRRRIMLVAYAFNSLIATGILLLLVAGDVQPWYLFVGAILLGFSRAFAHTSRRALMFQVVGPSNTVNALSLEHFGSSSSRVLGPMIVGGLLELMGNAIGAYSLLVALHVITFACIALMRVSFTPPTVAPHPVLQSIAEGIRYALSIPSIAGVLAVSVLMNGIFMYNSLIPVMAQEHLHVGPALMGLLFSAGSLGTVIGSLIVASRRTIKYHGRLFLLGCFGVVGFLLAFALSPWYLLSLLVLVGLGLSQAGFSTMQSSILLLASPPSIHSRMFGAQTLAIGLGQFAALEMGALASVLGTPVALAANALGGILILLLLTILMPGLLRPVARLADEPTPAG